MVKEESGKNSRPWDKGEVDGNMSGKMGMDNGTSRSSYVSEQTER